MTHDPPPRPHSAFVGGEMQTVPSQHPLPQFKGEQVVVTQRLAAQVWSVTQATQSPPLLPQADG